MPVTEVFVRIRLHHNVLECWRENISKKEQKILRQLVNARESIRRKYNILKRNKVFIEQVVNEKFKPLVDLIDKLVTLSEKILNSFRRMKTYRIILKKKTIFSLESNDIDTDAIPYDNVGKASDATFKKFQ